MIPDLIPVVIGFGQNAAVLLAVTILYMYVWRVLEGWPRTKTVAYGILFGGLSWAAMQIPVQWAEGIQIDGRIAGIALGTYFGGPVAGGIALALATLVRWSIGGAGMSAGIASVGGAFALSLVARWLGSRRGLRTKTWYLFTIGYVIQFGGALTLHAVPGLPTEVAWRIIIALVAVIGTVTGLGALLLRDADQQIVDSESLERLSAVVRASSDPMYSIDETGKVRWANPAAEEAFGVTDGSDWAIPFDDETAEMLEAIGSEMRPGDTTVRELEILSDDVGRRPVSMAIVCSTAPDGATVVSLVFRDITDVIEAQRNLEAALETRNAFLASVSHELRTPLAQVLGFSEILAEDDTSFLLTGEREEILELIVDASETASDVLDDLLAVARLGVGDLSYEITKIHLRPLIGGLVKRNWAWEVSVDAGDPVFAVADEHRVKQIVRNLVTNAERYGGPDVRIDISRDDEHAVLDVSDNGAGIPEHLAPVIFDRFVTSSTGATNPAALGLGLWMCRSLAQDMGGDLTYHREHDRTIFRLRMPSV